MIHEEVLWSQRTQRMTPFDRLEENRRKQQERQKHDEEQHNWRDFPEKHSDCSVCSLLAHVSGDLP